MNNAAVSPNAKRPYVEFSEHLESPWPDEDELIKKIINALHRNNEHAFKKYKHAIRDAHAKSHGFLKGELEVYADLPDHLAQGLFKTPRTYPVIARLSSTHPALRSDRIRGIRAMALKVMDVDRKLKRALPDDDANTQDFVLVNHSEFPYADVHAYYTKGMPAAWLLARGPDWLLWFVTECLAGLSRILSLPRALALFAAPNTLILGETFHSSAPLRYGKYVAKISLAPLSVSVTRLSGRRLPRRAGENAQREHVVEFFRENKAVYEVRVQLCTDLASMPIEDATVPWSEWASRPRGVAKITFDKQPADTPYRRAFADDILSFNSWRGLDDHRPLGSINRLKKEVYEASSKFRHEMNHAPRIEPTKMEEVPK